MLNLKIEPNFEIVCITQKKQNRGITTWIFVSSSCNMFTCCK